jgi:hypothetical protein
VQPPKVVDAVGVADADDDLLVATIFAITDISANVARIRALLEEALNGEDPEDDA